MKIFPHFVVANIPLRTIVKHWVISSIRGLAQYRTASHIEKFDNIEHLNDEFI